MNVYWAFWNQLEAGARTHNTGHNIVGGYMANPVFSPNDPLFWLHHAFIDKTWADWQASSNGKNPPSPSTVIKPATMETGVRLA